MKPENSVDGITAKTDNQPTEPATEPTAAVTPEETTMATETTTEATPAVQPETPAAPAPEKEAKKSGKGFWIVFAILALVIGTGIGYVLGSNMTTTESQKELEQQVQTLEKDLEQAKESVADDIEDGQDAVEEGQASLETLQAENAALQATVDEQAQKIADLEKQLEDATDTDDTTTQQ